VVAAAALSAAAATTGSSPKAAVCDARSRPGLPLYLGAEGWLFHRRDFAVDFRDPAVLDSIATIAGLLEARGARVVFAPIPAKAMVHGETLDDDVYAAEGHTLADLRQAYMGLLADLRRRGVRAVDLLGPMLSAAGRGHDVFFRQDPHWASDGVEAVAGALARAVEEADPRLAGLTRTEVRVARSPGAAHRSWLQKLYESACGEMATALDNRLVEFRTTDASPAPGRAPVALVGTSMSMTWLGLPQLLHAATGLGVAPAGIWSGGLYAGMRNFVASDAWHSGSVMTVVWEVPVEDLRHASEERAWNHRQIEPAIDGACGPERRLASRSADLSSIAPTDQGRRWVSIEDLGRRDTTGAWLRIEVSEDTARDILVRVRRGDGSVDEAELSRSSRNTVRAPFFLATDVDPKRPAVAVAAGFTAEAGGTVTMLLCRRDAGASGEDR
jgi:hypothetical protein